MRNRAGLGGALVLGAAVVLAVPARAQQTPPPRQAPPQTQAPPPQAPPVPQPFPGAATPDRGGTRTAPARGEPTPGQTPPSQVGPSPEVKAAGQEPAPSGATLGAPVYPGAVFLESYDAGSHQRYYLFGTDAPYEDIVQYYKNVLRTGGHELFKAPATQQFDLAKFDNDTMAFQPSVVVKDYTWNGQNGYLFVSGTTEQRYKTIIQIVPPPAGR
jgi:hypothetical protein